MGLNSLQGKNHKEFSEAQDMIDNGGMFSISNQNQFNSVLNELINDDEKRMTCGSKNRAYVDKNKGAVVQIMDYLIKK